MYLIGKRYAYFNFKFEFSTFKLPTLQFFNLITLFKIKDTALEKHRLTLKKMAKFFVVNSIVLLSSLPSNRTCWTVFILIF